MKIIALISKSLLAGGILLAARAGGLAADWPQFRGPQTIGVSAEKILTTWTAAPKCLWRVPAPAGFSSMSVADGRAFTVVSREVGGALAEVCVGLDAGTGKELWAVPTGIVKYEGGGDSGIEGNKGGDGPRSTPSVQAGRVFVYSSDMVLHCLDAATGKTLWKKDIIADFAGHNIRWKSAMSPLLDGERLYLAGGGPGQTFLALDQATGEAIWKSGSDAITHATPVLVAIGGVRQIVFIMQSGLVALDPAAGKPLWQFPFPYKIATACSPVVEGDLVFCTAGYDIGGAVCQVAREGQEFQAKEVWRIKGNDVVGDIWSTPVCKDGYLYGMFSFKRFGRGPLKCVEFKTGEVKWQQPGFGPGQVLRVADKLLALADDGQLVLIQPSSESYKEITRFKAVNGKCWSTPALSDGRLYIHSTKECACFDVSPPAE